VGEGSRIHPSTDKVEGIAKTLVAQTKAWSREHNKNPGAGGGFRAELLAGHEAALRSEEVSWRPEVPARVAEVQRA
jgi:hypothetical protein